MERNSAGGWLRSILFFMKLFLSIHSVAKHIVAKESVPNYSKVISNKRESLLVDKQQQRKLDQLSYFLATSYWIGS